MVYNVFNIKFIAHIAHIIKNRKGIFVSKRNLKYFTETTKFIMSNYTKIQKEIEQNKFPLEKDMFKQISDIVKLG